MKTIWDCEIPLESTFELELPAGARVLGVCQQRVEHLGVSFSRTAPHVHVLVDDNRPIVPRSFKLRKVGDVCGDLDGYDSVGCFETPTKGRSNLICHLFVKPEDA